MARFSVMFQLEAETLEDAEAAVGQWIVTPDTILSAITGSVMSQNMPVTIADGGPVAEGTIVTPPVPPDPPALPDA